ncbi:MAG: ribonuclease P protein component [Thiotrichales bacterium]|nr:ribonuclease P protein component [Thiotrichales bacterium]
MRRDDTDSLPEGEFSDRRFRPEFRLRQRKEFKRVLSGGTRLNAQVMTFVLRSNGTHHPRLGLAVPRRAVRRAVVRHRLKRRIRESFRHHTEHLAGLDIVVIARAGAGKMDSKRFRALLASAWVRASATARRRGAGA